MPSLHFAGDKPEVSKYDRVIVENRYRNAALCHFVAARIDKGEWPGIVFVRKRRHASLLAGQLSSLLGRQVPAVTSTVDKKFRGELAAQMRERDPKVPVAVATAVWSTGLDIPSLVWVMMAGAGQAPVGLKQSVGRGSRLADGKSGYIVYDVQDVGPDLQRFAEQSQQRLAHYRALGFVPGEQRLPEPESLEDPNARELARLLAARLEPPVEPAGRQSQGLRTWEDSVARVFGACMLVGIVGGVVLVLATGIHSCLSP